MTEERTVPYSSESERGVLGCLMLDAVRAYPEAQQMKISSESFHLPANQTIWEAIDHIGQKDPMRIDVISVTDILKTTSKLEFAGGMHYLTTCIDDVPTVTNAAHYIDIIRQKEILRKEIELCREIAFEAYQQERGDEHILGTPQRFIDIVDNVIQDETNAEVMERIVSGWEEAQQMKHDGKEPLCGIPLPWRTVPWRDPSGEEAMTLQKLVGGLEPGTTILAGRPSQGKTTIEDMISLEAAEEGFPVARVTMDSTIEELLERALVRKSGVSLGKLKTGHAGLQQLETVRDMKNWIETLPIHINSKDRELNTICSWIRRMKMKHDVQLVTIDYVQQIQCSDLGKFANTNMTVTHISGTLKALALELKVPILILSQLNRVIEKENREPQMSDLRDSGSLEQDASKILFVYNCKKACDHMNELKERITEYKIQPTWIHVVKNKTGARGRLPFWFHKPYYRLFPAETLDDEEALNDMVKEYAR